MRMTNGNKLNIFVYEVLYSIIVGILVFAPFLVVVPIMFGVVGEVESPPTTTVVIVGVALPLAWMMLVSIISGMARLSGHAFMYTKMRAKTPLAISK